MPCACTRYITTPESTGRKELDRMSEDKKPGTANGDICECGEHQLPQWTGNETARACQACGLVDERNVGTQPTVQAD